MKSQFPDRLPHLRRFALDLGPEVARVSAVVLDDPKFATWSASVGHKHHYGRGGLQEHTFDVVRLCVANRALFLSQKPDYEVSASTLFLSAVFHDIGKLWDYVPVDDTMQEWVSAPHKRTIHHITRSALVWSQAVRDTGCCSDIEEDVLHAILSHHGLRDYGSPVFPKTREAWLLHMCDGLSARMDDCDRLDRMHG